MTDRSIAGNRILQKVRRCIVVGGLVLLGLIFLPAQPAAAQYQCLVCIEIPVWNGSYFETWHYFDLDTAEQCAQDPESDWCRACGNESQCHPEPQEDECHEDCAPAFVSLVEAVDNLFRQGDVRLASADAEFLAAKVRAEPRLRYDPALNAVEILDCQGSVGSRWMVSAADAPRFLAALE